MSMQLTIKFFGRLQESTEVAEAALDLADGCTVAQLVDHLVHHYPALAGQSFQVAVNRRVAPQERVLEVGDEVAALPPFSGG